MNGLRNYDIESTRRTYEKYLLEKGADIYAPEMKFAIEIAVRGGTDMVIEWLLNDMKEDKKTLQVFQRVSGWCEDINELIGIHSRAAA